LHMGSEGGLEGQSYFDNWGIECKQNQLDMISGLSNRDRMLFVFVRVEAWIVGVDFVDWVVMMDH